MTNPIKSRIAFSMSGILFLILSCIPREEPLPAYRLNPVRELPEILRENSGLTEWDGLIWFINDGGNEPVLYGYSLEQDTVLRQVVVKDVMNSDWEDIVQNEEHIFIGDFGNNAGSRTDLRILIISKSELLPDADTVAIAGTIDYHYSDQTDFTPRPENTPYDCEAFIATNDSLYLFTKDWPNMQTAIYSLPAVTGSHEARFRARWAVNALITSASWEPRMQQLILLGYSPWTPLIRVFSGFSPETLSYVSSDHKDFDDYPGTQTEGIVIFSDGGVYVSSEGVLGNNATLFSITYE